MKKYEQTKRKLDSYVKDVIKYKYSMDRSCFLSRLRLTMNMSNNSKGEELESLFAILDKRQKSHGYKKQNYCENYYYITTDGTLGCIKNRGHDTGKALGKRLEKLKIIDKNTHEAKIKIEGQKKCLGIKGVELKHNRILEDLKKTIHEDKIKFLSALFDKSETCTMTIDRNFKIAYDPKYRESAVYQGDLCTSGSCMSCRGESAQKFYGAIPCCYVARFEKDGEQVGRCIMYEHEGKRHFIRIYGKPEYLPKMYRLLKAELKPEDLFGRSYAMDIDCKTEIKPDTPNMYLDGAYYGLLNVWNDEHTKDEYIFCKELRVHNVIKRRELDENNTKFNLMKSTSDGTVEENFDEGDDYYICDNCGCRVYEGDVIWCGDYTYCCCDCAHEDGWYLCKWCDEWEHEDDGVWCGDDFYCCEDHARKDGWVKCDCCGKWISDDNVYTCQDDVYCESCWEDKISDGEIVECAYCEEYIYADDAYEMIDTQDDNKGVYLCWHCKEYRNANNRFIEPKKDDDVEQNN